MRRLILLFLLVLWPALASARGIEPQLVAEGPAPPGGEVELAIHMRPAPGWHGYWQNPGDAGLPMDVKWQLPKGFAAGPLRYPVPVAADRRGPDELRVRARLCRAGPAEGAGGREGHDPDPRRSALARLHRQDLRARAGRARARSSGRHRNAEPRAVRCLAPSSLAQPLATRRPFRGRGGQAARRGSAPGKRGDCRALPVPDRRRRRRL